MTDWIVLQAVACELRRLRGARIDGVALFPRRIVLRLRSGRDQAGLALETRPELPSVYREDAPARRTDPSAQLQVLRRHLEGARLVGAYAPFGERALLLCLRGRDRFGEERPMFLLSEFFGTHPDLLLGVDGIVAWALFARRSAVGDPFAPPGPKPPPIGTLKRREGAPPPQELLRRVRDADFSPTLLSRGADPVDAWAFPLQREGLEPSRADSMLDALSALARVRRDAMEAQALRRDIRVRIDKARQQRSRSLARKEEEYLECALSDGLRRAGEALKLHLREIPPGSRSVRLPDPSNPHEQLEVPLDPELGPTENMEAIFRRYRKLVARRGHLTQDLETLREDVSLLDRRRRDLDNAQTTGELRALRAEIAPAAGSSGAKSAAGPLRFWTQGGHEVLVGRSARENDSLTRAARPGDLWFHTKDRQGAHCILRPLPGRPVGAPDRLEAALLAAYYSKQRKSSQVPVDYTFARHVRRPRGAAPGFVLYDHHETLFVTPDEGQIREIRGRSGNPRS